ncbi:MAG: peptide-methionine (S)-S-oxide reductase [bacterium]|nr:MAG: peptide-methionine (S)-S-oxide reductase [bacterium]KAF0150045.1 MAG: peptide-methionine (S)-S-oxide reductase [bacterium]KAF0169153.1 MAG: peptide-methionine (S)-S-oxide reductase [bacterium]TXT16212.1 MAG: peptide-methionine (S)-S-oxide reductase [bacterium]
MSIGNLRRNLNIRSRSYSSTHGGYHVNPQTATLAGGCFWCLESAFNRLEGVEEAVSGYMGGATDHPTYQEVCAGDSGHAEVVQIRFDADRIAYRDLLDIFFELHDPTTLNRQGNDVGSQYRSAIFWHDEAQRATALEVIAELTARRVFDRPIVTEVATAARFWPAEDYHQRYFEHNPRQPYCVYVVAPKLAKFMQGHAARLKPGA